jgi:predicted phosphohydrolase
MEGCDHVKRMCSMCCAPKNEIEFRFMRKQNRYNSYCKQCEKLYQREYQRYRREGLKERVNA